MKMPTIFAAVALGAVLLGVSYFWVQWFPGTSTWTAEKAAEYDKVKDRLHNLSFIVHAPSSAEPPRRHADMAAAKAEYDKVKERHGELSAEFESAYNSPRTTATALKWTGVGLLGLGVVGWFVLKEGDA